MPQMNSLRWAFALAIGCACLCDVRAVTLTTSFTEVIATVSGACAPVPPNPSCGEKQIGPLAAHAEIAPSFSTADLPQGFVKVNAAAQGQAGISDLTFNAEGSIEIRLRNTTSTSVVFPQNSFLFNFEATLSRSLGASGIVANETGVTAFFDYTVVNFIGGAGTAGGSGGLEYYKSQHTFAPLNLFILNPIQHGGGSLVVSAADDTSVSFRASSGEFQLGPDQLLTLRFRVDTMASATGAGSFALVNASNSAHTSLLLPEGVSIDTGGPAWTWISTVPEASSSLLLSLGAVLTTIPVRRRRSAPIGFIGLRTNDARVTRSWRFVTLPIGMS